jgi:dihydrofolate reductase
MRKLKLQMQTTVDGFVGRPGGELDWVTWKWDDALKDHVTGLTEAVDCIILGRKLAEGFIPHWKEALKSDPPEPGAKTFVETPKVVFSRTLTQSPWDNTTVADGDLADEVRRLKDAPGGEIIAYGGATFVSELIRHNLIDEYHLFVNPAAIGEGLAIFREHKTALKLTSTRPFECGIVALTYTPVE